MGLGHELFMRLRKFHQAGLLSVTICETGCGFLTMQYNKLVKKSQTL